MGVIWCLEKRAELAADQDQHEYALLLAGAAARRRDVLGTPISPAERGLLEPVLKASWLALGERGGAVYEQGRSMLLDEAVKLASMTSLHRVPPPTDVHR
jgi:hypothetical protein